MTGVSEKPATVLVVDDSAFMRKLIAEIIESSAAFRVVAVVAQRAAGGGLGGTLCNLRGAPSPSWPDPLPDAHSAIRDRSEIAAANRLRVPSSRRRFVWTRSLTQNQKQVEILDGSNLSDVEQQSVVDPT